MNHYRLWGQMGAILLCLIFWLGLKACTNALDLPEVRYSHATGKCVSVLYGGPDDDCNNIPRRHHAVIVQ